MSNPLLLDTHALVWLVRGDQRLGAEGRRQADLALQEGALLVSAISFWETALLWKRRRVILPYPVGVLRRALLQSGLVEVPVTGEIGVAAAELEGLHGDPADRLIIATALIQGATLITADANILGWGGQLPRRDART